MVKGCPGHIHKSNPSPHTHAHTLTSETKAHGHCKGQEECLKQGCFPAMGSPVLASEPHLLVVSLSRRVISNLEAVQVHKVLEVVGVPSSLTDEQGFVQQEGVPGSSWIRCFCLASPRPALCPVPSTLQVHPSVHLGPTILGLLPFSSWPTWPRPPAHLDLTRGFPTGPTIWWSGSTQLCLSV